jgi:hypothetical protein
MRWDCSAVVAAARIGLDLSRTAANNRTTVVATDSTFER